MFLTILLYFCASILTLLSRKILQLQSSKQTYEEWTQAIIHTSGYSSKALVLYEIRRVSIEVHEYRSIVRNEGNDQSLGEIILMFLTILLFFYTHLSLSRKILQLQSSKQIYDEWTQAIIHTSGYTQLKSSRTLRNKKGEYRSTEVQKYSEKHENDFTSCVRIL